MTESDALIGELGESDILRRILALTPAAEGTVIGPGDDAAVLRFGGDVVATTDTLVHGPDFRLAWTGGRDLGWKAAAVNLADVAAMGARPTALLVALAVPNDLPVSYVEDMARGLAEACAALAPGCAVVGGDLTVSDVLTVAVTALGDLEGRPAVLRSGARPGDVVALVGDQGAAARGLAVLFDRFRADGRPVPVDDAVLTDAERADVVAQLRPSPPVAAGVPAAEAGAHAMMDVSDGLLLDARRMAKASGVTIDLERALLGPDPEGALTGGEDHPLLACFAADARLPEGFRVIGRVLGAGSEAVTVDGAPHDGRGGWDPYQDWDDTRG
ncbi:thiamine-phosphate kinase [Microbacterium gorillae]|uniref:thiamine-phosphate kinase n=1 Tax=Microbacterium gorillae TaxID=1231063 RepID=UPI00058C9CE6|nr:thiamine-phosphate kinase [Microbacterium gorillae]